MQTYKGIPRGVEVMDEPSDGTTHQFVTGKIVVGDKTATILFLCSNKKKDGDFLPANVKSGGTEEVLWNFQTHRPAGFKGIAKMFSYEGELVIGLITFNGNLVKLFFLTDILNGVAVEENGETNFLGQTSITEIARAKFRLARREKLWAVLTEDERQALAKDHEFDAKKKEAEKLARAEAKREKRRAIISRPNVTVFGKTGGKYFGTPVVGDEWQMLQDRSRCVLVKSYDDEAHETGEPLSAFIVRKTTGGRMSKEREIFDISFRRPTVNDLSVARVVRRATIIVNGEKYDVAVFDKLPAEVKGKLNSGMHVAVGSEKPEDGIKVFQLKNGRAYQVEDFQVF